MRTCCAVLLGTLLLLWMVTPAFADDIVYSNGPLNGQHASWSISGSFVVSNSFTLTANYGVINRLTGFEFWAWTVHGDHPNTITWSLTSQPNGGIVYASGTTNLRQQYTFVYTNRLGFDVYRIVSPPAPTINLRPGNYWLNLTNATTTQGNSMYWDENDGVHCGSRGCPSTAYQNGVSIGSETFIILALCPHCVP